MKVLIEVQNSPIKRFFVKLPDQKLIDEVKTHVSRGRYSKAIRAAFGKGKMIREISEKDVSGIDAKLILTQKSAHYDLM